VLDQSSSSGPSEGLAVVVVAFAGAVVVQQHIVARTAAAPSAGCSMLCKYFEHHFGELTFAGAQLRP